MAKKTLLSALLAAGLVVGGPALAAASSMQDAQAAIAAAKAANKQAASVDGEWTTTDILLKGAAKAESEKDYAKAVKLAKEAERDAKISYTQAMSQKHAGNPSYLTK